MDNKPGTPLPWFAGCQNDALFIVAGRPPALSNDHPWHDAPRVPVAKLYGPAVGDCLPVDADKNAAYIVHACNAYPALVEKAEALAEALAKAIWIIDSSDADWPDEFRAMEDALTAYRGEKP